MSGSPEGNGFSSINGPIPSHRKPRRRNNANALNNPQTAPRTASRYEFGREDVYGPRVTKIHPIRENGIQTISPPSSTRYPSTSPPPRQAFNANQILSALRSRNPNGEAYGVDISRSPNFNTAVGYGTSPSSAPSARMRPLSHPNNFIGGDMHISPPQGADRGRRMSAYSSYGHRTFSVNPPLPHEDQPHFHGPLPLPLGLSGQIDGLCPGDRGYYCGMDTLNLSGHRYSKKIENVVLVGYEGGLDVYRMGSAALYLHGKILNLRGAVIGAKILPWTCRDDDLADQRPLVALTVHGPVLGDDVEGSQPPISPVGMDCSKRPSPQIQPMSRGGPEAPANIHFYRTTVEIYSLKTGELIDTVFSSPLTKTMGPIHSPLFEPPPPVGDLKVDANGKFLVVASGVSGEVFLFSSYRKRSSDTRGKIRCLGKLWTTVNVQTKKTSSKTSSQTEIHTTDAPEDTYGVPIMSLSHRLLALVPPSDGARRPTLDGVVLPSMNTNRKPPGVANLSPPPIPPITCLLDIPEESSWMKSLTRDGAQAAIRGATWASSKGAELFNSYFNKNQPPSAMPVEPLLDQGLFPPTHAYNHAPPQIRNEQTIVSLYDLQRFIDNEEKKIKNVMSPLATFEAKRGCSFLSFSPTGLMLMTVSENGDDQDVWDLLRLNDRKERRTLRNLGVGPHVRQVAKFSRMTVANTIDVTWLSPLGNKVALLTDKGTVHLYPLPDSAFNWPPLRRARKAPPPKDPVQESDVGSGYVNSAFKVFNSSAKTITNAVRARSTSNGTKFPKLSTLTLTPAAGAKGSKAVAMGLGRTVKAGADNLRHAGDNKLHLPSTSIGVQPNRIRWLTGRKFSGCVATIGGDRLEIWRIAMRPVKSTGKRGLGTKITKSRRYAFTLAPVHDFKFPPALAAQIFPPSNAGSSASSAHGLSDDNSSPVRNSSDSGTIAIPKPVSYWPADPPSSKVRKPQSSRLPARHVSYAEIQTSSPYQPFYTDHRVTMYAVVPDPAAPEDANPHHIDDPSLWAFGTPDAAPGTVVWQTHGHMKARADEDIDDSVFGLGGDGVVEESMEVRREGEDGAQMVVTTRRRRKAMTGALDGDEEEGFFEDDCEVWDFAEDRV